MRQVVNGRSYDTDTATRVATGRGSALYQTAEGAFFAHYGSNWEGERPHRIEAMSADEARQYYDAAWSQEVPYEVLFGQPEER
jgi:hypothetical protein